MYIYAYVYMHTHITHLGRDLLLKGFGSCDYRNKKSCNGPSTSWRPSLRAGEDDIQLLRWSGRE